HRAAERERPGARRAARHSPACGQGPLSLGDQRWLHRPAPAAPAGHRVPGEAVLARRSAPQGSAGAEDGGWSVPAMSGRSRKGPLARLKEAAVKPAAESDPGARLFFEHSPLPMWVYDLDTLRPLDVNQAALEQYGYSRD